MHDEADTMDDLEHQRRLREAAQRLADAITKMVLAARNYAFNPDDADLQLALKRATEELRAAMTSCTHDHLRQKAITHLEEAAKRTVEAANKNISAARASEASNMNESGRQELNKHFNEVRFYSMSASMCILIYATIVLEWYIRILAMYHLLLHQTCFVMHNPFQVADILPLIISSVKQSEAQPDNQLAQFDLISTCQEVLQPGARLVNSGRLAAAHVRDGSCSIQLTTTSTILAECLAELRLAITRVRHAQASALHSFVAPPDKVICG